MPGIASAEGMALLVNGGNRALQSNWHDVCKIMRTMRSAPGCRQKGLHKMSESPFGIHAAALELRSQRMGMIAANIAHAATPGYKARDIDFDAALKARMDGDSGADAIEKSTLFRVPVMPSLDGNTVELANEQMAFAENAVAYSATLSFIKGRANTLMRALKGQ